MKDTLYISHNIFLDKQQRYSLFKGKKIKIVGVSLYNWTPDRKESSEYFVLYDIIPKRNKESEIFHSKKGYTIYIKNNNIKSIFSFIKPKENFLCSDVSDLLDISDGGKEWMFITKEIEKNNHKVKHTIEIKKLEDLVGSI